MLRQRKKKETLKISCNAPPRQALLRKENELENKKTIRKELVAVCCNTPGAYPVSKGIPCRHASKHHV